MDNNNCSALVTEMGCIICDVETEVLYVVSINVSRHRVNKNNKLISSYTLFS